MAAGERNKSGKPTDIVVHHATNHGDIALCGRRSPGCISLGIVEDVTCLACMLKIKLVNP